MGGIRLQIVDKETGFLVKDVNEAAEKAVYLLKHPDIAKKLGKNGHERVKENFLITKHLERYLDLLLSFKK